MATVARTRDRVSTIDWSFAGRFNFWLESMWLSALALVPVLFSYQSSLATFDEAKTYALHFFALATFVLLIWDASYRFAMARRRGEDIGGIDVLAWLRADRSNMLLAAIVVFTFVYVISTALSPMPYFSFWGVTPASSGYKLYSFLSIMVILIAIVTHVRSMAQVWRILYLIAGIGTITALYGIGQRFDYDPLGNLSGTDRVISTFGNPIYFGAYLVMSIPITVAIAADHRNVGRRPLLLILAIAVALQLSAMWFTGSRGPLVGLVAGAIVSAIFMLLMLPKKQIAAAAAVAITGGVLAAVLIFVPGDGGDTRSLQFGGELSELTNRDGGGNIQAGLAGRSEIWGDILELSVSWKTPEDENTVTELLRPLFGVGPDMLRFSTPLVAGPRGNLEVPDHAHNRMLQVLAEEGWVGFFSMLSIVGIAAWLLYLTARRLISGKRNGLSTGSVIFIAIAGALAGVAAEQLTGVGRVSDILTSWVLVGLLVVLYRNVSGDEQVAKDSGESGEPGRRQRTRRNRSAAPAMTAEGQAAVAVSFIVGLSVLVIALVTFLLMDIQMLRASRLTMEALEYTESNAAYQQFLEARDLAPQVELFSVFPAEQLYDDARDLLALEDREQAVALAEEGFRHLLTYHERNPLALQTRILLAEMAALLVEIGAADFTDEMVFRYQELAEQFPTEAGVLATVANAYAAAERYEESLAMVDRSLALEPLTRPIAQAWWVRASVLERLGRTDEAIASYDTSIEREPGSKFAELSHRSLAKIYELRGDTELAEFHSAASEDLKTGQAQ